MCADDLLAEALDLAEIQLARLAADEFDAYLAALPEYEAVCGAVALSTIPHADPNGLAQLIDLQRQIASRLENSKRELGQRMSSLRGFRRANAAYSARVAIPHQPIGQA